ncbi:MAG: hypothetical protein NC828_04065 [Candidatus Omnitrophica bacterium]|nr:hypothetical protein [Candidatus Omnitrophota bacterium]
MSKRTALFLVILSFITGFFVCDLVNSIVDDLETYFPQDYTSQTKQQNGQPLTTETTGPGLLKIENPAKAIRNSNFELLVYLQDDMHQWREYYIWVNLIELNGDKKFVVDKLKLADLPNVRSKDMLQIGPFKVNIPPQLDLGKYYIGVGIAKNPDNPHIPFKVFKENVIEVVSLN